MKDATHAVRDLISSVCDMVMSTLSGHCSLDTWVHDTHLTIYYAEMAVRPICTGWRGDGLGMW